MSQRLSSCRKERKSRREYKWNHNNMVGCRLSFARNKNSIEIVHVVSFFLRLVYPSILFVLCVFSCTHIHAQPWTHTSQNACSKFPITKGGKKSHERKCDYQSMSHRKSIKCLHHSTFTLVPFSLSHSFVSYGMSAIAHFDWFFLCTKN